MLVLHHLVVKAGGQYGGQYPAAIQRGNGDEIEHRQVDVQKAHDVEDLRDSGSGGEIDGEKRIKEVAPQLIQDEGKQRQQDIGGGAGQGGEDHALFDIFEVAGGHRDGLGPAEPGKEHEHRADEIEVRQGIEGEAPQIFGGGIAQFIAGPGMGAFVDGNGGEQHHGAHQVGK